MARDAMLTPYLPPDLVLSENAGLPADLSEAIGSSLDQIVGAMPLALIAVDPQGTVRLWNRAAERMFGWTREEVVGQPIPYVPPDGRVQFHQLLQRAVVEPVSGADLVRFRRDGSPVDVRVWTSRILTARGDVVAVLGVLSDETVRRQQEQALAQKTAHMELLQRVAVAANESDDVEAALSRTLALVCGFTRWPVGHAFVVEDDSRLLKTTGLWHTPEPDRHAALMEVTATVRYGRDVGLAGQVLGSGRPAWTARLDGGIEAPRAAVLHSVGLVSASAFPVLVRSEVAAVLEFFSSDERTPDPAQLDVMLHVGTQVGRVIERTRAERERVLLTEHAQRAQQEARAARRKLVLGKLSEREKDVMRYLSLGADNLKIAANLGITERTVKAHITSLLRKLELENRTQVAVLALGIGMVGPEPGAEAEQ